MNLLVPTLSILFPGVSSVDWEGEGEGKEGGWVINAIISSDQEKFNLVNGLSVKEGAARIEVLLKQVSEQ